MFGALLNNSFYGIQSTQGNKDKANTNNIWTKNKSKNLNMLIDAPRNKKMQS
jgi:hypothetical protein